jgi:hypothetical protein
MSEWLDEELSSAVKTLVDSAPSAPSWPDVSRAIVGRKRRRSAAIGGGAVVAGLLGVGLVSRQLQTDGEVVVATTEQAPAPCSAWIAVHTLFDASSNSVPGQPVEQVINAEQAAFLVNSGDVPDRVASRTGREAADLSGHVVAKTNRSLGTIEITAWAEDPYEARALADLFAEELLQSAAEIQERQIARERDRLEVEIEQLESDIRAIDEGRSDPSTRDGYEAAIAERQQQLSDLAQAAAAGSNLYSFGSAEAFQVTATQLDTLFDRHVALRDC